MSLAVTLSERTFLFPEPHSQTPARAASGPSRSWDPSAAAEGEESARAALCEETGKGEPHDDIAINSNAPVRLLSLQPAVNIANAGLSQSSLNAEHAGEYSSPPQGQHDIV